MGSIDKRIVDLRFNNKQFEAGVKESMKSLENLKKGLELEQSTKSLNGLNKAGQQFSLAGIASGVDDLNRRFSTMGIVGMTAVQEITKATIQLGRTMTNAVITPMVEGGKKRALNIEQAKFQFKGLGMDVEKTMESANAAVRGTAYGLDEAAKVASQLGASGLRSGDEMTKALTAVSGVAAMTSSSYEDIGNIFVKVAGNGRLMGQELLQLSGRGLNAAAVLAESMGISEQAVREMTSKGQISFEMFYTAMEEAFGEHATSANETFTGSLSNMNAALARIGASFAAPAFENFRDIFNSIRPIIDDIHASMKPFIEEFNKFTRTLTDDFIVALGKIDAKHLFDFEPLVPILKGLRNVLVLISQAATAVKDAFNDIFPPKLPGEALASANEFRKLSMNFRLSDETAANLKDTFKGLFAVVDIVKMAVEAFGKALGNTIKFFFPVADGLLGVTGNLGTYLVALRDVIKESDVFNKVFETLGKILQPVATLVRDAVTVIFDSLASFGRADTSEVDEFGERLAGGFKPFTLVADLVRGTFEILEAIMSRIGPLLATIGSAIGKGLKTVQQKIVGGIKNADFNQISRLLRTGASTSLIVGINKFFDSLRKVTDGSAGILDSIKGIFTGLSDTLRTFQKDIQADTLMRIAKAILILTSSVTVLSMIDEKKLASSLMAISVLMGELFGSMAIFKKVVGSKGFRGITKITVAMIALSTAVLILAAAVKVMADLEWNELAKGLLGVGVLIGELVLAVHIMPDEGRLMKGAFGLILFAEAIKILSKSVAKFAEMQPAELAQGLIGVGVLLTELSLFMNLTDLDGMGMLKGVGIMAMATALVILSGAVNKLASLDPSSMVQGLMGLGVILAELAIFLNTTGDVKKVMSTAIGLQILAVAMVIFTKSIEALGSMTWEELSRGLIGFGGALGIITAALHLIEGALGGAAALLVVAGAIAILTPALILLGQMEMAEIGKSLLILAGALGVLGGASALLAPVIPAMLGLAGALTLLSVAIALIGGGIFALSAGITALSIAGAVGIQSLIDAVDGLIGLIPKALEHVANGLLQFVRIIGEGAPGVVNAVAAIFVAISEAVIKAVPAMVKAVMVFLTTMLDAIVTFVPELVVAGMQLVLGILQGIADNIGEVVVVAIEVVVNFIEGIASMIPEVIQAGFDLIIAFVNGLADAIRGNTDTLIDAMYNLMSAMIEAALKVLTSSIRLFKGKGQDMMSKGLGKGITDKVSTVVNAAKEAPKKALSAIGEHIKDFFTIGGDMMAGMAKGIANGVSKVTDAAKNVARKAIEAPKKLLGIRSPSTVFSEIGTNLGQGLTKGMDSQQKPVEKSGEKLGEKTTEGAAKGITKAKPKVVKAASKTSKATYESTKEWIDKQRKYHELSLEDELSKWKQIQLKYKKGSEERLEIDKRMKDIRKQMIKDEFDHSVNWINEEKYYKRLSLAEELAAWERVQARYYKGTEERKQADREVYRVKNELIAKQKQLDEDYYQATKDINDKLKEDIKSVTEEYENALDARASALASSYGLFDKVEESEEKVTGRELMTNLQDQVRAFDKWQSNLTQLTRRGVDEGLIKELQDMGPKSLEQIRALQTLSDPELVKYVELWREKHEQARIQAVKELEGLKTDTDTKIEELEKQAEIDLDAYKQVWLSKSAELTEGVVQEFGELNKKVIKSVNTLKDETNKEFKSITSDIKSTFNNEDWGAIGANIVKGIASGVKNNSNILMTEMTTLAKNALSATRKELGIKSPSREFAEIGRFSVQGLADGFRKFTDVAVTQATSVGSQAMDALANTMADISDIINYDTDLTPTIRPVIDMSNVDAGLESAFGNTQTILSINGRRQASNIASMTSRLKEVPDSPGTPETETVVNNYFDIQATIREEADIDKLSQGINKLQHKNRRGKGVIVYDRV